MGGKHERPEKPTPDGDPWFGFLNVVSDVAESGTTDDSDSDDGKEEGK